MHHSVVVFAQKHRLGLAMLYCMRESKQSMSVKALKTYFFLLVTVSVFSIGCVLSRMGVSSMLVRTFLHVTRPGIYFRQHTNETTGREATMVTAYFAIESKHTSGEYNAWIQNMLSLMDPMIIFTEPQFVDRFLRLRSHAVHRTKIVTTRLEDLKIAKMYPLDAWSQQLAMDPEVKLHKTYRVFWVWLNKLCFMVDAIRDNPFASDIFVWCDIGSFRDTAYNSQTLIRNTNIISTDKMLLMAARPPHNIHTSGGIVLKYDGVFENSDWYTAGALLAGYKDTVLAMERQFLLTLQTYREKDLFIGDDQPLLQFTCVRNNLCEFVTPYHIQRDKWFGLQYALHTHNVISLWKPHGTLSNTRVHWPSTFTQALLASTPVPGIIETPCLNADFRAEFETSVWTMLTDGDAYVRGAEKLGVSILSHTRGPLDLVVMELSSKPLSASSWARLQAVGWKRCTVLRITPTDEASTFIRFRDQFTKLHLWGMVVYKTVLYLDADTLVVRDIDGIFEIPLNESFMAAGRDYESSQWLSGFNMGVVVVRPNHREYMRLLRLQKFGLVTFQTTMAEQGFLNALYRDTWTKLPFEYNANLAIYTQDRVYWNKNIDTVRIIHYTMSKPWACDAQYAPVCAIWLQANASV